MAQSWRPRESEQTAGARFFDRNQAITALTVTELLAGSRFRPTVDDDPSACVAVSHRRAKLQRPGAGEPAS